MAIFNLPKNQQMIPGLPLNRSYTKDETDNKFVIGINTRKITVSATQPVNPQIGDLWVDIS